MLALVLASIVKNRLYCKVGRLKLVKLRKKVLMVRLIQAIQCFKEIVVL